MQATTPDPKKKYALSFLKKAMLSKATSAKCKQKKIVQKQQAVS